MGILLNFFLFGLWSLVFPIGKFLVELSPPIFLTGFRMTLGGMILLLYLFFRKQLPISLSKRQLMSLIALAFLSIYLTNILEFWSLCHLSAAKTCFIYSLSPFMTALLSYFHFNERMTKMKWVGLSLGMFGFLPVFLYKTGTESLFDAFFGFTWPELAMIAAVFFSVYGWVILRIIVKKEEISPLFANGASMLIGGLLAFATSFYIDSWNPIPAKEGAIPILFGTIFVLTIISNIFCYNLYGYLLKKYTATLLSLFGLLSPLFASLHSWLLLNETPSPAIVGSTFLVLTGLWIVYREEKKQGYIEIKSLSPQSNN